MEASRLGVCPKIPKEDVSLKVLEGEEILNCGIPDVFGKLYDLPLGMWVDVSGVIAVVTGSSLSKDGKLLLLSNRHS